MKRTNINNHVEPTIETSEAELLCKDDRMFPEESLYCEGRYKPLLRGYFHATALLLLLPLCIFIIWEELNFHHEFCALLMMASGSMICWGSSALFHCFPWDPVNEIQFQKLDHSAIFVKIASVYTSITLLIINKLSLVSFYLTSVTIVLVWICAAFGVWHVHNRRGERMIYWVAMISLTFPSYFLMSEYVTVTERSYAILGLLNYCLGAMIFSQPTFDLIPNILGNHEIFHIFTLLAAVCSYLMIHSLCKPLYIRCETNLIATYPFELFKIFLSHTITTTKDICSS